MRQVKDMQRISPFDAFWSIYPRKIGKLKAQKAYQKATKGKSHLHAVMIAALKDQTERKAGAISRSEWVPEWPNPATWLNGERWEDEFELTKTETPMTLPERLKRITDEQLCEGYVRAQAVAAHTQYGANRRIHAAVLDDYRAEMDRRGME